MLVSLAKKGIVIGGSSAGAAIQSKVMIQSGKEQPLIGQGFDLLPNAIVDQHFLKRTRLNRLIEAIRQHPDRRGFGVDEGNCLVLNGASARVVGLSYVIVVCVVDGKLNVMSFPPDHDFWTRIRATLRVAGSTTYGELWDEIQRDSACVFATGVDVNGRVKPIPHKNYRKR